MTHSGTARSSLALRLFLISAAAVTMLSVIITLSTMRRDAEPAPPDATNALISSELAPIASEALVFRAHPGGLEALVADTRRRPAHPRTLATFRALRAFPGAPPRIPHGLTSDEFRTTSCKTCHERGGFSQRFGAYAPVTPHPEWTECLQCHTSDAAVVGLPLPGTEPDALCRQCHARRSSISELPSLDWRAASWPSLAGSSAPGAPPPVPHDLDLRGSCIICHAGPGAVAEIRTAHPERGNCRQCHVQANPDAGVYVRPVAVSSGPSGGAP